ncbi:MAG: hypothetical protein N2Z85_02520 [Patescibacteria group bacterium]|nr:hypothetical protein [Patescibacteria group bacterium]
MKKRICFILISLLTSPLSFYGQENNSGKKAIDAFISATTKSSVTDFSVSNAKIIIDLKPGPSGSCTTNNSGSFAINFSNLEEVQGKESKFININFTIIPPKDFIYITENKTINIKIDKSEGPFYEFILKFKKHNSNSNNGSFVIERVVNTYGPPPKGAKQGKGSAVKTGDSYQGIVMHF